MAWEYSDLGDLDMGQTESRRASRTGSLKGEVRW